MVLTLEASGLAFAHAGAPPLFEQVNLTLARGQAICLLGANGAGKTTLLRCLLGLERPGAGSVRLEGTELGRMGAQARARRMAFVPQGTAGTFPFSVLEVVLMGRSAHLRFMADPDAADQQAARDALQRLGIGHLAARLFDQLSGGERQLVLVARALAQQAPLLLLDEPCTGLDLGHQVQVLQALRSLAAHGYGILLTTHLPEHAFALDAQVALLCERRLLGPAPAGELLTSDRLSRLYGTPVDVVAIGEGPARGQRVCVPVV